MGEWRDFSSPAIVDIMRAQGGLQRYAFFKLITKQLTKKHKQSCQKHLLNKFKPPPPILLGKQLL
jgi:hypothetical protein